MPQSIFDWKLLCGRAWAGTVESSFGAAEWELNDVFQKYCGPTTPMPRESDLAVVLAYMTTYPDTRSLETTLGSIYQRAGRGTPGGR